MTTPDVPRPAPGDQDWIDWADDEEQTSDDFRDGVSVDELSASGVRDATTFLRGDNRWAVPPGGGGGPGGNIDGGTATTTDFSGNIDGGSAVIAA